MPRVGSAVLIEKDGKYLLGKRNKPDHSYQGVWVIPGGGVHDNETTEEAAIREIKEETGLDIRLKKLVCIMEIIAKGVGYHSVVFFYLAEPLSEKIEASDDLSEAKFFYPKEMEELRIASSAVQVLGHLGVKVNGKIADTVEHVHVLHSCS